MKCTISLDGVISLNLKCESSFIVNLCVQIKASDGFGFTDCDPRALQQINGQVGRIASTLYVTFDMFGLSSSVWVQFFVHFILFVFLIGLVLKSSLVQDDESNIIIKTQK